MSSDGTRRAKGSRSLISVQSSKSKYKNIRQTPPPKLQDFGLFGQLDSAFPGKIIYIYIYACNLTWWAVLGFQDSMKQQEIRRNKGKKTKKLRKKKTKNTAKTATFLWRFFWAIFHYKTGHFSRCLPSFCPPIEVTAIYTYIYTHI